MSRAARVWPGRDEKILTAWNGLMIAAFAQAGAVFDNCRRTVSAASAAANFILGNMRTPDGRLYRTMGEGQPPKLSGYLEDYAFLADALVTLYEASFEGDYGGTPAMNWLRAAVELAEAMLKHFADPNGPGFFFTADDHEQLIARTKDLHDGSTPSGNAMAVTALLRLAALTGRPDFAGPAERALRGYRETMAEHPAASGQMLVALDFYLGPVQQIAIVGPVDADRHAAGTHSHSQSLSAESRDRVPRPRNRGAARRVGVRCSRARKPSAARSRSTSARISPARRRWWVRKRWRSISRNARVTSSETVIAPDPRSGVQCSTHQAIEDVPCAAQLLPCSSWSLLHPPLRKRPTR